MKATLTFTLAMTMAMAIGCESTQMGGGKSGKAHEIVAHYHGDDAGLAFPEPLVVHSKAELEALSSTELADIDYIEWDKHSVVILALGEQATSGYWAHINSVTEADGKLYINATVNSPAGGGEAGKSYPYCAVEVPKFNDEGLTLVPITDDVSGKARPSH